MSEEPTIGVAMSVFVIIALIAVTVIALSRWAERRWQQTGEFFEEDGGWCFRLWTAVSQDLAGRLDRTNQDQPQSVANP